MIHLICPNPAIDRTLLIDGFVPSKPNRPYEVKEFPGGKGFNVAYAIGFEKPDINFCVHTIAGGRNGDYLAELAEQKNVPVHITQIDVNTRVCNIVMDTKSAITYPIYENSFDLSQSLLDEFTNNIKKSISDGDFVVFSGSLMKGMPSDYFSSFMTEYQNSNVKFFVDTSGAALVDAYNSNPFAIKINDEEILDIFPEVAADNLESLIALLASEKIEKIPVFIITLGEKGILAKIDHEIIHVQAKKVEAKNPIACGDFFLGGLVKNLALGNEATSTIKKAISYSTANVLSWYPELNQTDINSISRTLNIKHYKKN